MYREIRMASVRRDTPCSGVTPLAAAWLRVLTDPMGSTDKFRQCLPAPPAAPSSLLLSSAAPTQSKSSSSVTARTPPLPDDRFVGWDGGPDPTIAICEYNVEGDWELRR